VGDEACERKSARRHENQPPHKGNPGWSIMKVNGRREPTAEAPILLLPSVESGLLLIGRQGDR
jgi:hypothetical protein